MWWSRITGRTSKTRLGIDYEVLKGINPRIILASISGFGQDGPYHKRAGFDQIAQGMGGLMWVTGKPGEGPMRAGTAVADSTAGLYAANGYHDRAGREGALRRRPVAFIRRCSRRKSR